VKRLIAELEIEHPEVKSSMVRALANVAPRHLLDRRLNPLPDLRDLASRDGRAPLPLVRR
jgi:tRNA 2-thiocytidine biosynthesis protein TtcA